MLFILVSCVGGIGARLILNWCAILVVDLKEAGVRFSALLFNAIQVECAIILAASNADIITNNGVIFFVRFVSNWRLFLR